MKFRSLFLLMFMVVGLAACNRANVTDVKESILIGVVLAVVVVFFFLANGRSTIEGVNR